MVTDHQDHIDDLLRIYLDHLAEYSSLRQTLCQHQSDMYRHLARANFCAERGMRYGPDHFDERMQATRILEIQSSESGTPKFSVKPADHGAEETTAASKRDSDDAPEAGNEKEAEQDSGPDSPSSKKEDQGETEPQENADEGKTEKPTKAARSNDPLRWFGLFSPPPLRMAQADAIKAVEQIVPKIVCVKAEMLSLEIEIGRARKKRAKEHAAEKKKEAVSDGLSDTRLTA